MHLLIRLVPFAAVALAACSSTAADSSKKGSAAASPSEVVASGEGFEIRSEELEKRATERLFSIRQQEYEIRREVLDEMITEKLVEREAKARGVSPVQLTKAEVDDKVGSASQAEIDTLYERAKGQLGGRSKDEVRPEIEKYLKSQRETAQRERFNTDLRTKSKVMVRLEPPRAEVDLPKDAPSLGPATAPVTIVEFSDYQCPFCHRAQGTVDQILAKYGDKVRFVHQDFPLDNHPRAIFASRASRCAGDQGKYWEYHRGLLSQPSDFSDDDLVKRAEGLKLDAAAFKKCVDSKRHDEVIQAAMKAGRSVGVNGTPAFFVNGRMLSGARPLSQFEAIIDDELSRQSNN